MNSFTPLYEGARSAILDDFYTLLRFPSVSTKASHRQDLLACSAWVKNYLEAIDFTVESWTEGGPPVLFAQKLHPQAQHTLLIYHHYDVQPVDPLSEWTTPPFEPTVRNGAVYARGACDNKGQLSYTLSALKYYKQMPPLNIKLLIEGEEECGSASLPKLIKHHQKKLKADSIAIIDSGLKAPHTPTLVLGCRGLFTFELTLTGPKGDLHSGSHGGLSPNPLQRLCSLIASLHDAEGRVNIPHFYDAIRPLSPAEHALLDLHFDKEKYLTQFGPSTGGEHNYSPYERTWLRPTLEVNGLWGGYTEEGVKTVLPSQAHAKLSCRLVDGQDVEQTAKLVFDHIKKITPKDCHLDMHLHPGSGAAFRSSPTTPIAKAFSQAQEEFYKGKCSCILMGGSIPIAAELQRCAQGDLLLFGTGLDTDQFHAPNEHFSLERHKEGFCLLCRALEILATS